MPARNALSKRALADVAWTLGLVALAAVAVGSVRGRLAKKLTHLRETSDVYVLPPPHETVRMSLGYRAALADILWANVLVSQGLHTQERRRFENLTRLLDTINELDPTYRSPYLFADALITFQANETPMSEVLKAREILERGVANRPFDAQIWLAAGGFISFIAPAGYIKDEAEQERWRLAGAPMLMRAAELSGDNASIGWQALGAAGVLGRSGQRDVEIRFLERTLAVTDDPKLQEELRRRLEVRLRDQKAEELDARFRRLDEGIVALRHQDLPFISRRQYMIVGPPIDPAYCAGPTHELEARCALTWKDWEEREMAPKIGVR
jgi:hypothetical protein